MSCLKSPIELIDGEENGELEVESMIGNDIESSKAKHRKGVKVDVY